MTHLQTNSNMYSYYNDYWIVSVRGASYGKGLFDYPLCKLQHKPLGDAVYIKFILHFYFWTLSTTEVPGDTNPHGLWLVDVIIFGCIIIMAKFLCC